jgi:putative hydrolase of the HAD superfamily
MNKTEQIHYIKLIRESARPLEPLPVILPPEWEALLPHAPVLKGIKAVLFDLYGTLFISAAGDIHVNPVCETNWSTTQWRPPCRQEVSDTSKCRQAMEEYFHEAVQSRHEAARAAGIDWPEVRVEEIWARYRGDIPPDWEVAQKKRSLLGKIGVQTAARTGRELAIHYELALNPVYPMPYAEETLHSLIAGGRTAGIISNAQFYSPLLFNAFFNASPAELGFDPDLLIYSFEEGEAKPSFRLFDKARQQLVRRNIAPEETLYVGNDMRNDILPAAKAGFATALFAGDRRSLRLREDDPACSKEKPTVVIKDLRALA